MREHWLHGWYRDGSVVVMGTTTRCCGCGRITGTICAMLPEDDWQPPPEPDWPFGVDCPVCQKEAAWRRHQPLTADNLAEYPIGMLRQALQKIKSRKGKVA